MTTLSQKSKQNPRRRWKRKDKNCVVTAMPFSANGQLPNLPIGGFVFRDLPKLKVKTAKENQSPKTKKQQEGPNDFYPTHGNSLILLSTLAASLTR